MARLSKYGSFSEDYLRFVPYFKDEVFRNIYIFVLLMVILIFKFYKYLQKLCKSMKRALFLAVSLLWAFVGVWGQEIDLSNNTVYTSDKNYCGVGYGKTVAEAKDAALADLIRSIAVSVKHEFVNLGVQEGKDGEVEYEQKVESCLRTYSQATLTNVEFMMLREEKDNVAVLCYIERSELHRIYEGRINKAKALASRADECLAEKRLDMALQYYYASYSLIRSVQHPNEVLDDNGKMLIAEIPMKIRDILQGITVTFKEKEDDIYVDLLFFYKGEPISSLDFEYNDGRSFCPSRVNRGNGSLQMIEGYQGDFYHIRIEYEYMGQWRGDEEMESVMNVLTKRVFKEATHTIKAQPGAHSQRETGDVTVSSKRKHTASQLSFEQMQSAAQVQLNPSESQLVSEKYSYEQTYNQVLSAIKARKYSDVMDCFTLEGLDVFNRLIAYGSGRVVGEPNVYFFKGTQGKVAARGLRMSFTFPFGKDSKQTYVEDVIFYFNKDAKIENIAFGIGEQSTNDIISRKGGAWNDIAKESVLEFLENYKTAYCLERLEYIKTLFSDESVIIVGNVAKAVPTSTSNVEKQISIGGQQVVTYNRYTKDQYIERLEKVFNRNAFVNIKFTHNNIQFLEKFQDRKIYGIMIGQEYNSSTYADMGFLYLIVDMTNRDEPTIIVRTWEPNEVDLKDLYGAGDFYNL